MKILYLSYDGLTDALGQSQILAYQKKISTPSVNVSIISFEKPALYAKLGEKIQEVCTQNNIHWYPLLYTKNPPVLSTLWDIRKAWGLIVNLQQESTFDIVHCRGYISALLGEKMKKKFGTKFIFDMRGWWPDEKKESDAWPMPLFAPVYAYFKKKERHFFQNSDITVSLTEAGKKEIVSQGWKEQERVRVISTCTDLSLFGSMTDTKRLQKRIQVGFPPSSKILVYSGALGGNYPLKDLFLLINLFLSLSPSHHCLILSKDSGLGNFDLPERTKVLSVNYTEVSSYLAICDLGFIYYKKAFSNIGRCPTKLGEYWACGLRVICPKEVGDVDELFATYPDTGYTVNWERKDILQLLTNLPDEPDISLLQNAASDYFSLERGIKFYIDLYKELVASNY